MTRWRNWGRTERARGLRRHLPRTEADVAEVVADAAAEGRRVKVVGSGHSFTAIARPDTDLLDLGGYDRLVALDEAAGTVTVESGAVLGRLVEILHARGWAMPNLGDVTYQTVGGALATGTHGTGGRLPGLAAQVAGFRLVDGAGRVHDCGPGAHEEAWRTGRVGLGALGVMTEVTLRVVPAFVLEAVEEPMRMDDVLRDFDRHVADNDHFECYWVPHTGWALTKRNNRTDAPARPMPRARRWWTKTMMENVAFGAVCRLGRAVPPLVPALARALPSTGRLEYSDASHRVFASPRLVRFREMEYAIPRAALPDAMGRLRRMVDERGLRVSFPVEVRAAAADDVPLSTAHGRDTAYVAVHMYVGVPYEDYFREVERIMVDHAGRPHWGKIHFQSAATLRHRYDGWSAFARLRDELDPRGTFTNGYLERVLGR